MPNFPQKRHVLRLNSDTLGMDGEFIPIVNDPRMMDIIRQFKYHDHNMFGRHLKCHQSIILKTKFSTPCCDITGNFSNHTTERAFANKTTSIHNLALVITNLSQCPSYNELRTNTDKKRTPCVKTCFAPLDWCIGGWPFPRPIGFGTCGFKDVSEGSLLRDGENHYNKEIWRWWRMRTEVSRELALIEKGANPSCDCVSDSLRNFPHQHINRERQT